MNDIDIYGLTGEIVRPNEPNYDAARLHWNRAVNQYPDLIVFCLNQTDITNALRWAKNNHFVFRIRSGRHHYEGYSTGDQVLVIDVSRMNTIAMHDGKLQIECGANNREVYDFLSVSGIPFPGGDCPTVGVCGFALGGGWGLSCRKMGLGCDSMTELELIDCDGNLLIVNAENHADLFWACRGAGGGNFGVVVSMTFALPEKADQICYIELKCADVGMEKQAQFLLLWQRWLSDADERITMIAKIYRSPKEDCAISGKAFFYGTPQEAEMILRPFREIDGLVLHMSQMTFHEAITIIQDNHADFETFQSTGRFVSKPLNDAQAMQIVTLLQDIPQGSVYSALTLYALGGKVGEIQSDETAFFYRDADYIISIQSQWTDEQEAQSNKDWVSKQFCSLKSITQGSYINFPYCGLENPMQEYYGENADRLRMIKKKYDPNGFFSFPQSIR